MHLNITLPPSAALSPREDPGDMSESAIEQGWVSITSEQGKEGMASESVTEYKMEN